MLQREIQWVYISGAHTLEWGCNWSERVLFDIAKSCKAEILFFCLNPALLGSREDQNESSISVTHIYVYSWARLIALSAKYQGQTPPCSRQ